MALALSDLSYDLLTLARTYDRANDFTRRDEYDRLIREIAQHDQEWEEATKEVETERDRLWHEAHEWRRLYDVNTRVLSIIADIAREALASTEERDDMDDNEITLLYALEDILRYAES